MLLWTKRISKKILKKYIPEAAMQKRRTANNAGAQYFVKDVVMIIYFSCCFFSISILLNNQTEKLLYYYCMRLCFDHSSSLQIKWRTPVWFLQIYKDWLRIKQLPTVKFNDAGLQVRYTKPRPKNWSSGLIVAFRSRSPWPLSSEFH